MAGDWPGDPPEPGFVAALTAVETGSVTRSRNQHAIQIEIDRSLYMDESRVRPNAQFDSFRDRLTKVIAQIVAIGYDQARLAAE